MADRAHILAELAAVSPRCDAVQLAALPSATRLLIRGNPASLGLPVPETCRTTTTAEGHALLWLGPDEFLLLAPDGAVPLFAPTRDASIVDVSHRDTALTVTGTSSAWAINAFCALDLHPSAFAVGMCTRTLLAKAEIVLSRLDAMTFRIDMARSFAPYVWACLETARREFLD